MRFTNGNFWQAYRVAEGIDEIAQYVARIMAVVRDGWNEAVVKFGAIDYDAVERWDD